jgi:hypothetical protein
MNQSDWFILSNRKGLLCVLGLTAFTLLLPLTKGADSPFRAHGRMTMVNFKNGEPSQTNATDIKVVFAQGKWCMIMRAEHWEDETAIFFDGTNECSVSHKLKEPIGQRINGFVAASEVPYGGQWGQTAWLHFCRQRWASQPRDAFPNLMSYEGQMGVSNLRLTLTEQGEESDATFEFLDGAKPWLVEKWHAEGVDKATGVPRYSERKIFSRVGSYMEGKLLLPPPGRVFDKPTQIVRTEVSKIEIGDFSNELTPPWLGHGLISVTDKRFSGDGDLIVYTVTNRIPTKAEMWKSPELRKEIMRQAPGMTELR